MVKKNGKSRPTTDPKGRCGTVAGYRAHNRRNENPCRKCKTARTAYARERKLAREGGAAGASGKPSEVYQDQRRRDPDSPDVPITRPEAATPPPPAPVPKPSPTAPRREVKAVPQEQLDPDPNVPEAPAYLRSQGRALWDAVLREFDLNPAGQVQLGEACRTVDRLERMAAALSSRSTMWFELEPSMADQELDGAPEFNVVVNGMIGEARQLQTVLRATLKELGVSEVSPRASADDGPAESLTDELKRKRQERLAMAAEREG